MRGFVIGLLLMFVLIPATSGFALPSMVLDIPNTVEKTTPDDALKSESNTGLLGYQNQAGLYSKGNWDDLSLGGSRSGLSDTRRDYWDDYPQDPVSDPSGSSQAPVPEPATLIILGAGLAGGALLNRRGK